jgi:hypothetical protein
MDSPREVRQPESITYGLLPAAPAAAATSAPACAGLTPATRVERRRRLLLLLLLLLLRERGLRWTPRARCVEVVLQGLLNVRGL